MDYFTAIIIIAFAIVAGFVVYYLGLWVGKRNGYSRGLECGKRLATRSWYKRYEKLQKEYADLKSQFNELQAKLNTDEDSKEKEYAYTPKPPLEVSYELLMAHCVNSASELPVELRRALSEEERMKTLDDLLGGMKDG